MNAAFGVGWHSFERVTRLLFHALSDTLRLSSAIPQASGENDKQRHQQKQHRARVLHFPRFALRRGRERSDLRRLDAIKTRFTTHSAEEFAVKRPAD